MCVCACMSLAGCSGGKFSASNTCQSSSISGPSATSYPNLRKISMISSLTIDTGWRDPSWNGSPGIVRSKDAPDAELLSSRDSFRAAIFSVAAFLSWFSFCPNSLFISGGTDLNSSKRAVTEPFFPSRRTRAFSISCCVLQDRASISASRASIFSFMTSINVSSTNLF